MNLKLVEIDDKDLVPPTWEPVTLVVTVTDGKGMINIAPRLDKWILVGQEGEPKPAKNSPDWTIWLDKPRLLLLRGAIDAALAAID